MAHELPLVPHGREWSTDAEHGQYNQLPELEDH